MGETAQARCRCDTFTRAAGAEPELGGQDANPDGLTQMGQAGPTSPAATDAASKADQPCTSPPLPHDGVKVVMHILGCRATGQPRIEGCSVLRRPLSGPNVCTTPATRRGRAATHILGSRTTGLPSIPSFGTAAVTCSVTAAPCLLRFTSSSTCRR